MSGWWNDEIKAVVRRKETAWKGLLVAGDEKKKMYGSVQRREEKDYKKCIIQIKKKVNEQFGKR